MYVQVEEAVEIERLNAQQFSRFRDFIYNKCGIRIDEKKATMLSHRIRRRLKASRFETFDEYYRFLTSAAGASELGCFLDTITTNETFFFRTEKHFEWLETEFLREMIVEERAAKRPRRLRIWSAGCATGAEPYSIAICLAENLYRLRGWSLEVLGTDISEEALRVARDAAFKLRAVEEVSPSHRRRYFQHDTEQDVWNVRPVIKSLVAFQRHNLMELFTHGAFDCIFIRNVLIYFDRESKQVVVDNLITALAQGGYLVVGPSEGIYDLLGGLQKIAPLIYRKSDPALRRPTIDGDGGKKG